MATQASSGSPRYDRTANAILDAAAHLYASQGTAASMGDVARAAGVARATLYRYYQTRESLLKALAARAVADVGARLADARLDSVPVEEAVERIVRAIVTVGDRYAVLLDERIHLDLEEVDPLIAAPIRAVFGRGIETGTLRDDLPLEILLELFGGLLATAFELVAQGRLGLEDAAAATSSLFLQGARASGANVTDSASS
jgi:TetR/AcrR family transcriptional regulator, mexCD-oprJ operon repressor